MKVLLVSCGDVATEAGLRFSAAGHQVSAWRRNAQRLPQAFTGHSVDLLDPDTWPEIDPDTDVVLLTPVPVTRDAQGYERSYLNVAKELVARLRVQAPNLSRLIYVSSTAVCGGTDGAWVDESNPMDPSTATAKVLAATEQFVQESQVPVTILRASGIYGPGRTRLLDKIRSGDAVLPAGSHWTNRIYRDDLAAAVVHEANLGSDAESLYLATDDEPVQLGEVYEFLAELINAGPLESEKNPAPTRSADRRLSNAKLRASGFVFQYPSFREGYRAMLESTAVRHQ